MAEIRERGRTRMWCRRCKRPLRHDHHRKDTVSASAAVDRKGNPRLVHDGCGGMVFMSKPARK